MEERRLPLGFGMALAQNEAAMQAFAAMSPAEKEAVVEKTHRVRSKREMQQLVAGLVKESEKHRNDSLCTGHGK